MKTYKSPCVAVLGDVADATAAEYSEGLGVVIVTDRQTCSVHLQIMLPAVGQIATAYLPGFEAIDEVIRDLLAAKADLIKLRGKA